MLIVTYIWPHTVACPTCGHYRTTPRRTRGRIQYRACPICGAIHKIIATHAHAASEPGGTTRVVALKS